jgi:hypothetical protein
MATFSGSVQEFHDYIGPRLRNAINGITRASRKQRRGECQRCKKIMPELESAHVHGRGRRTLIEQVLSKYSDEQGNISGPLQEIEREILEAHLPISETFLFLCAACHRKYDSGSNVPVPDASLRMDDNGSKTASPNQPSNDGEFRKLEKIAIWAKNPQQINHRIIRAFLFVEKQDGEVEYSVLKQYCTDTLGMGTFAGNFNSMKTDSSNSHGKVFFIEGSKVRIWDRVRKEIDKFFGKV